MTTNAPELLDETTDGTRQTVSNVKSRAASAVRQNPKKTATATTLVLAAAAAAAVFLTRRRSAKATSRGRNRLATLLHR